MCVWSSACCRCVVCCTQVPVTWRKTQSSTWLCTFCSTRSFRRRRDSGIVPRQFRDNLRGDLMGSARVRKYVPAAREPRALRGTVRTDPLGRSRVRRDSGIVTDIRKNRDTLRPLLMASGAQSRTRSESELTDRRLERTFRIEPRESGQQPHIRHRCIGIGENPRIVRQEDQTRGQRSFFDWPVRSPRPSLSPSKSLQGRRGSFSDPMYNTVVSLSEQNRAALQRTASCDSAVGRHTSFVPHAKENSLRYKYFN